MMMFIFNCRETIQDLILKSRHEVFFVELVVVIVRSNSVVIGRRSMGIENNDYQVMGRSGMARQLSPIQSLSSFRQVDKPKKTLGNGWHFPALTIVVKYARVPPRANNARRLKLLGTNGFPPKAHTIILMFSISPEMELVSAAKRGTD